jgi:hypothetical protein
LFSIEKVSGGEIDLFTCFKNLENLENRNPHLSKANDGNKSLKNEGHDDSNTADALGHDKARLSSRRVRYVHARRRGRGRRN